ncbi:MAG: hypothetical protein Q8M76_19260 [Spirochaetaceae bacterium]|nr:hypothetical protein [Spirochaetaceae bacterium]
MAPKTQRNCAGFVAILIALLILAIGIVVVALALRGTAREAEAPGTAPPATIRVGSYNLAILGDTKLGRPMVMTTISAILAGFDLAALQEVGSNASKASDESCRQALEELIDGMNKAVGGESFSYLQGDQFAFVYRKDRLRAGEERLYDGERKFTYRPLVARFSVPGTSFDFVAMTVHTSPDLAKNEVPALADAMDEIVRAFGEPDLICLGDFNADGSYYDEGAEPGLEGFPDSRFITVIPDDADTTVGEKELAYDRIELTRAMMTDYAGSWGVIRPGEVYDLSGAEGPAQWAGTDRALSDHFPVWADFVTGADAD